MKLLLLSQDLMIASRVEGAARQLGFTATVLASADTAVTESADVEYQLLLVDLRLPELDIEALVSSVRQISTRHLPIVACGPHVHEARLDAARQVGCDAVITRGQLDREVEAIIRELIETAS